MLENLGTIFTVRDLILFAVGSAVGIIGCIVVVSFWLKREWRLVENLKRPIMLISSPKHDMKFEATLLRNSGFFNIPNNPSDDPRSLDIAGGYCLFIIAYSKNNPAALSSVIQKARESNTPVIIYAEHDEIDPKGTDIELIRSYYLAEIANSPLRLMNLIFSILSIYKYSEK